LGEIVRRLPNSETLIEVKNSELVIIECENSHFEIKGLSPAGYPAIPTIDKENTLLIKQKTVRE
jgi:DNA polymerase-3 subunit beta